ncbi:MAG: DUF6452 family protein [Bacteroidota bacterium]|uniref:DUF6452 family protein n=1 Tax=Christiangramia sp. TaxID=1931228 RepID=UPI000C42E314|nr:hypothetical protein [Christiangramia sp.]MEE2773205.1 DUF6452 family protein [Bacteroidota bacterium]
MKKYSFGFLIVGLLVLLGCQRDDLCPGSTNTTPLLIIRFYDFEAPDEPTPPQNLSIAEIPETETDSLSWATYVDDEGNTVTLRRRSQDSIAIPLRTDQNLTRFYFILDTEIDENGVVTSGNADTLTFSYDLQEEYLNRACSFRRKFINLKVNRTAEEDGQNWIREINIEENNVEDENQAHVSIYF